MFARRQTLGKRLLTQTCWRSLNFFLRDPDRKPSGFNLVGGRIFRQANLKRLLEKFQRVGILLLIEKIFARMLINESLQ